MNKIMQGNARNIFTATEDKIAALEALVKKYEGALNKIADKAELARYSACTELVEISQIARQALGGE